MKMVGVVLILMLLVAGVAVGGSRAQALPADSVAFAQCRGGTGAILSRCVPLVTPVAMGADEGPGGDGGFGAVGANEAGANVGPEPDHSLAQHALAVILAALAEAYTHYFGRGLPLTLEPASSYFFDPVP